MDQYDYIIIGAGSAGCVLANRLSEDPGTTVCLLEAGPSDINPLIQIPAGFMYLLKDPALNWLYDAEGCWGTKGRSVAVPRGRVLGGSSAVNGLVFNRGQPSDFDVWTQLGNPGWSYADVLAYFMRLETKIGAGDDDYRGRSGEHEVHDLEWRHPLCDAFIKACLDHGIPRNDDYNGRSQEGVSYVQRSAQRRRRISAARAFLHPVKRRRNLHVITHAHATRILIENRAATGVIYRKGGVTARRSRCGQVGRCCCRGASSTRHTCCSSPESATPRRLPVSAWNASIIFPGLAPICAITSRHA